jgi:hypothetical protein
VTLAAAGEPSPSGAPIQGNWSRFALAAPAQMRCRTRCLAREALGSRSQSPRRWRDPHGPVNLDAVSASRGAAGCTVSPRDGPPSPCGRPGSPSLRSPPTVSITENLFDALAGGAGVPSTVRYSAESSPTSFACRTIPRRHAGPTRRPAAARCSSQTSRHRSSPRRASCRGASFGRTLRVNYPLSKLWRPDLLL